VRGGVRRRERRGRREEPPLGINLPNAVFIPFLAPEATVLHVFFPTGRDAGARWVVEDSSTYPSSKSSPFPFFPFLLPFLSYLFYDGHIGIGASLCIQDFAFSCDFLTDYTPSHSYVKQPDMQGCFSKQKPGPGNNPVAGFSLCDIITHSLNHQTNVIPMERAHKLRSWRWGRRPVTQNPYGGRFR